MAALSQANQTGQDPANLPVAADARMGKLSLTMAWWAVCSAMFYIVVGASLALAHGTRNALIGMLLSVLCYGLVNSVLSRFAMRSGLSVALFSRLLFGSSGACLATLIFFSTAIYYAVFEGSVIAVALNHLYPQLVYPLAALLVVLYSVPLILGSVQHWLDKLNGVLLPVYLGGLLVAVGLSIARYGYQPQWLDFGPASPGAFAWWDCFVAYMGVWILMLFTFDYARFGKPEDAGYHGRWNFGMPFYAVTFLLNGAAGIYLVSSIPHEGALNEVSVVMAILQLMGLWGLLFVWATQTRINTANYYLATLNMQAFFGRFGVRGSYLVWALAVGVIVYVLMLADVFAYLLKALAYQGIFVVAWVGVALAQILFGRTEVAAIERVAAFNGAGLSAWFGGTALGLLLMWAGGGLASFSAPLTGVLAFVLQVGLSSRSRGRLPAIS
ncbi:allantoin permease [Pseudomonas chlororaphis subsp. aurantiaca]|uniref:purine-cytosine permease family protein n=1 Tax=Pseudomonas TaxID=286 RepID=UPI000C883084|nr:MULTISPECIES: allantoin permease [Pseudomonas]AZC91145.1 Cytosine permease [Pseudomonas chlororaphis subsp. piscium]PMY40947.1 allantoin permease [Pseudomonas sp. FW306-2-2C-D06C]PYC36827.1 allantoin permease [Pseudomonas chlororaphis]UQS89501.1 allantoin permease [Pseudomonas chlororaphis subsp. piscium]WMI98527.1 allantoin permease [Pseudomonas chlororaphis subsp. aurantiaca]